MTGRSPPPRKPMPRSMTGFGRASRDTPHGRLVTEIRAVNARFAEVRVRVPGDALELEMRLRDQIKAALARGKADCHVRLEPTPGADVPAINTEAVHRTFEELSRVVADLSLDGGITLDALLRATPREDATGELWREEEFQREVEGVVGEALRALGEARESEGAKIAALLGGQLDQVESTVAEARGLAPKMVSAYTDKLRQRIEELARSQGLETDAGRTEQEVVFCANRMDVTEEIDRLDVHCAAFREAIATDKPVGRRLDFLVQEILREVNTLGSKARDTEISGRVVDLKVVVEQMREQVQNVE